jgi:hypothetical protein
MVSDLLNPLWVEWEWEWVPVWLPVWLRVWLLDKVCLELSLLLFLLLFLLQEDMDLEVMVHMDMDLMDMVLDIK